MATISNSIFQCDICKRIYSNVVGSCFEPDAAEISVTIGDIAVNLKYEDVCEECQTDILDALRMIAPYKEE